MRKKFSVMLVVMQTLLLMAVSTSVFNFYLVKAPPETHIYIRSDGTVEPPTAPIHRDGNVYAFTNNITYPQYDGIVVQKSNIIINGSFHTLQGSGDVGTHGFNLTSISDVVINNTKIKDFHYGIWLNSSSFNTISENKITNNIFGVFLIESSNNNDVSGNTITNSWGGGGVCLYWSSSDNTVSGNTITNSSEGVWVYKSSNYNTISGNTITNSSLGIDLEDSCSNNIVFRNAIANTSAAGVAVLDLCSDNIISGNNIANNNLVGVGLTASSFNTVSENNITNNNLGISLADSSSNTIYHNNFVDNTIQADCSISSTNLWDDDYPSGGNYWSNYMDVDLHRGPNQDILGSDGIWDHPYTIDANNQDRYPFVNLWSPHGVAVVGAGPARMRIPDPFFGMAMPVVAVVENQGVFTETFDVSIFYDSTLIGTSTVTLGAEATETVSFNWDLGALPEGVYTISANASIVPGETNTVDNYFVNGEVRKTFIGEVTADGIVEALDLFELSKAYGSATLTEDINSDGIVSYTDFGLLSIAYGSMVGSPGWNPYADLDNDGDVDPFDFWALSIAFEQTGSPNWNAYADMNADNKIDASDLFDLMENYGEST